jgi:DNA-binding PadR family transcriptional regulator
MAERSTTTLGYAILGLLAREALSDYDLSSRMRARVGLFWQARHSQIYPELARLEEGGSLPTT